MNTKMNLCMTITTEVDGYAFWSYWLSCLFQQLIVVVQHGLPLDYSISVNNL